MGIFRSEDGGILPDDVYRRLCAREPQQKRELQERREADENAVADLVAAMNRPEIGGRLVQACFDAAAASRRSDDPAADRRRAQLRSLQFFGHAIGVPVGTMQAPKHYLQAGARLRNDGDADGAAIMENFGLLLFTLPTRRGHPDEVSTHHERWCGRHHLWQIFPDVESVPRPGDAAVAHPDRRTVSEDEILARLLNHPEDSRLRDLVGEDMFTSHLRAELFRATADGGRPDRVRSRFADAMLRAPGWALPHIGGPGGTGAMRYLDRLQATEVTARQAVTAAHEAEERHTDIVLTADSDLRQVLNRRQRIQDAGLAIDESPPDPSLVIKATPELIRRADEQNEQDRRERERREQLRQDRAARMKLAARNVAAAKIPKPRPPVQPPPPVLAPASLAPQPR